jgi:hypothetical protein
MTSPTSKLLIVSAALAALASPVFAQDAYNDPNYDYGSRSDFISLNAGDANSANIAIQTPHPWPSYINDTHIHSDGTNAEIVMQKYKTRNAKEAAPSTVINIGTPLQ